MSVLYHLGIDLGSHGALTLVAEDGQLLSVFDMPVTDDGPRSRPTVNAVLLHDLLSKQMNGSTSAFIEYVGSRPTDGHASAFAFGRARGVVEGVLGSLKLPVKWITTPSWRRAVGLPIGASKDQARAEALRRWPGFSGWFSRKKDDGRAEAALVAMAGILQMYRRSP